jgi:hypothetical protein
MGVKIADDPSGTPGIYGLSLSPDGKRIAVVVGRSWRAVCMRLRRVRVIESCRFAISPDGEYFVEGGEAMVTLYRLQP